MRLKILIENIRHHFVLSFFILFISIVIVGFVTLSFETEEFLYHVTEENYSKDNHNFDIVIKSNTGLSLKGTRGDNQEFEALYKRRASFYNVTLFAKTANSSSVVQVFEGENTDFNLAFNQNLNIKNNETVITNTLATSLNLKVNDEITIYIGEKPYIYKVIDIINDDGIYLGESAFITGYNVAQHYALRKMYNLILLDIEKEENFNTIYQHIKKEYEEYTITDINDEEYIKSLATTSVDDILRIVSIVLIGILFLLINMYSRQVKKQIDYFEMFGKANYYKGYQVISWLIIIVVSYIFSFIIVNLYLDYFLKVYNCTVPYYSKTISHILGLIPLLFILIIRILPLANKIKFKKKIYIIAIMGLFLLSIIGLLVSRGQTINSLFVLFITVLGLLLIVELITFCLKYIPFFLTKIYIYDFSKHTQISKFAIIIRVFIIVITALTLSTLKVYNEQITSIPDIINIDKAIATKTPYSNINIYEQIKIDNNVNLLNQNLNMVVALNSDQYDRYLNYVELNNDEKNKFDSDKKYVILSKYYENVLGLNIGDNIDMLINEEIETYEILKFANHFYHKMAIVNKSDYMYYGYVLDENDINEKIIENFSEYRYTIINFQNTISLKQNLYNNVLTTVKYVLVAIIITIILLSIYMSYQEHLYQKESLIKLKLLGCNNQKMLKISSIKLLYDSLISIFLGFIISSIVLRYFDNIAKNFNIIFYINYDLKIVLVSLSMALICLIISFIYTNIKYKKL